MRHKKLLFGLLFSIILGFAFNGANAQSQEEWIALGPDNVSGRSRAIIFDRFNPNVLYSGGVAGGLFISVNNGKNWQEISLSSDNQANLAITAIAQDNNGVIYLGTGESNYESAGFGINNDKIGMLGNGVYRLQTAEGFNKEWATNLTSDDAKYDWAKTNIKFQLLDFTKPSAPYNYGDGKSFINRIAVNEITNKVYVATQAGLMLLEQDSWSEVNNLTSVVKVGDIVFNSNGVAAVYFNDSEAKVAVSNDDFASDFRVIYKVDSLKNFEPAIMSIDRIRLAFGNNYPNRLFVYNSYVADAGEGYITRNLMLVRTNDINEVLWRRTTPQSYINGQDYTSMAMAVNDYVEPEQIYLGGYYVYRGYDANESDIYYWEQMSRYTNSQNSTNGIRTSDEYVSSGMNEIILKKNPLNYVDSTMIVVASSAGIHIYSYDSVLAYTAWRLSTKNMNTTQFYSVAVTPDASIVGGTVDNGSVFIANSGELGVNKSGDVLWTANSEGYNPNKFQLTTDGGMVAASQFQRLLPSQRKSLILSRPYGQIARTYSNEGDYSLIDDVTWQFGSALFDSITLTDGIENDQFKNDAPTVTPLLLWESTSSTLPDTMNLSIDKNTVVNFIYDSTWREGSWINAGDSVLA
ncbi:MAG: hypothetical protein LBM25_00255, partial [Bacteroidales bacterium]|nr:hypothetical protein [Bacteroidales bacterium]